MAKRMFCGELNGDLVTSHIAHRADSVRRSVALMFDAGAPIETGWARAKREGWRVVPVYVDHAHKPIR